MKVTKTWRDKIERESFSAKEDVRGSALVKIVSLLLLLLLLSYQFRRGHLHLCDKKRLYFPILRVI